MNTPTVPSQYNRLMPYLIVPNALGLMRFLQTVFGATEQHKTLGEDGTLMHGEVRIGDSVLMVSEASEQWNAQPAGIYIHHADADEGYRAALAAGATSVMEPADQSYGRSCGVKDPHGNVWWITTAPASE
jgi:PhnB protein